MALRTVVLRKVSLAGGHDRFCPVSVVWKVTGQGEGRLQRC